MCLMQISNTRLKFSLQCYPLNAFSSISGCWSILYYYLGVSLFLVSLSATVAFQCGFCLGEKIICVRRFNRKTVF